MQKLLFSILLREYHGQLEAGYARAEAKLKPVRKITNRRRVWNATLGILRTDRPDALTPDDQWHWEEDTEINTHPALVDLRAALDNFESMIDKLEVNP